MNAFKPTFLYLVLTALSCAISVECYNHGSPVKGISKDGEERLQTSSTNFWDDYRQLGRKRNRRQIAIELKHGSDEYETNKNIEPAEAYVNGQDGTGDVVAKTRKKREKGRKNKVKLDDKNIEKVIERVLESIIEKVLMQIKDTAEDAGGEEVNGGENNNGEEKNDNGKKTDDGKKVKNNSTDNKEKVKNNATDDGEKVKNNTTDNKEKVKNNATDDGEKAKNIATDDGENVKNNATDEDGFKKSGKREEQRVKINETEVIINAVENAVGRLVKSLQKGFKDIEKVLENPVSEPSPQETALANAGSLILDAFQETEENEGYLFSSTEEQNEALSALLDYVLLFLI